jgi:uncharacterized membrane protein (UPF0136 family)
MIRALVLLATAGGLIGLLAAAFIVDLFQNIGEALP